MGDLLRSLYTATHRPPMAVVVVRVEVNRSIFMSRTMLHEPCVGQAHGGATTHARHAGPEALAAGHRRNRHLPVSDLHGMYYRGCLRNMRGLTIQAFANRSRVP
ncbi:hypothetical protein NWF32_20460 [Pseudomonas qingdaonensis]|nr:hypothetical protein [Pseudomonas qingdaonensis]